MPSRDRVGLALGAVLTAAGFIGLGAAFYVGPPTSEQLQQLSDKERVMAQKVDRPLDESIYAARVYLKPELADEELSSYWGDDANCSRTKRDFLMMNDTACGILDVAKAKQGEYEQLKKADSSYQSLLATVERRRSINMGGFLFGVNMIPVGLTIAGVFSGSGRKAS